jgi:hypothetical protein
MATGQTLLDTMEIMDRGLQLQSGETGVTLVLQALCILLCSLVPIQVDAQCGIGQTVVTFIGIRYRMRLIRCDITA